MFAPIAAYHRRVLIKSFWSTCSVLSKQRFSLYFIWNSRKSELFFFKLHCNSRTFFSCVKYSLKQFSFYTKQVEGHFLNNVSTFLSHVFDWILWLRLQEITFTWANYISLQMIVFMQSQLTESKFMERSTDKHKCLFPR